MNDDELLAHLAGLDPVPAAVRSAALSAFGHRAPGAIVTDLTLDQAAPAAGLRAHARLLTFTHGRHTIDLEITDTLDGSLSPPAAVRISLRRPSAPDRTTTSTRDGHFTFPHRPGTLTSLLIHTVPPLVTPWTRL